MTNPLKDGALTENSAGLGTVTGDKVRKRAGELAAMDGRPAETMSQSDREQARQDLAGDSRGDPNQAALESAPESDRWAEVPGSGGHKVEAAAGEDEDTEGRSDNERLVMEGLAEAEHDRRRQAIPPG